MRPIASSTSAYPSVRQILPRSGGNKNLLDTETPCAKNFDSTPSEQHLASSSLLPYPRGEYIRNGNFRHPPYPMLAMYSTLPQLALMKFWAGQFPVSGIWIVLIPPYNIRCQGKTRFKIIWIRKFPAQGIMMSPTARYARDILLDYLIFSFQVIQFFFARYARDQHFSWILICLANFLRQYFFQQYYQKFLPQLPTSEKISKWKKKTADFKK